MKRTEKLGKKTALYLVISFLGTGVWLLSGCGNVASVSNGQEKVERNIERSVAQTTTEPERPLTPIPEDTNFVVGVVKKVSPAVVQINTSRTVRTQTPEVFNDPFVRRFFGRRIPIEPQERTVRGVGSGFVINSNGQILTNAHVVNNADIVTVTFADGRSFEGKVLGQDTVTDVAVVQIPAQNLPQVEFANSAQVEPGQWAIAIGNPLGLTETVTVGVVSATDRSSSDIGVTDKRVGFIQTDAAINPGNSGGPLLNARGQVIGVNTAIIGGAQGIGFAIPIDTAQRIAQQLITTGKVEHPYLGVQMVTLTPEIRQRLNNNPNINLDIGVDNGVLIAGVEPNSPAAASGIRPGDVIRSINNQTVAKAEQVQQLVEKNGVGKQLQVQLERNNQTIQLTLVPAPLPVQS